MPLARIRQGLDALWTRRRSMALPARFRAGLPDPVVAQWMHLSPYDQHHLLAVAVDLEHAGADEALVTAALLHDIGKAGRVTLVDRAIHVLLRPVAPRVYRRISAGARLFPGLRGLQLLEYHAEAGARLLERCGMAPRVVWLVRHHEHTMPEPSLILLQDADRRH